MAILISDSFKIRESTSDEWEDILFSINSPGVPVGGSAGQVLTKTGAADYATGWQDPSGGDVTADMLGIVIDGNSTPVGASVGQYVIVKNSTITGITDGLYTAAQAIPANTAIDSTYLTAVSVGGLNDLSKESTGTYTVFVGNEDYSRLNSIGKIAILTIDLQGSFGSLPKGWKKVMQVEDAFRPKALTSAVCKMGKSGTSEYVVGNVNINTDGAVNAYFNSSGTFIILQGTIVYFLR